MVCVGVCLRVVGVGGNGGLEVTGGGRYCKKSWSWSRFTPLTLTISSRSLTFCLHTRWFVKQRGTVGAQAWRFMVLHAYIFEFIDISRARMLNWTANNQSVWHATNLPEMRLGNFGNKCSTGKKYTYGNRKKNMKNENNL